MNSSVETVTPNKDRKRTKQPEKLKIHIAEENGLDFLIMTLSMALKCIEYIMAGN